MREILRFNPGIFCDFDGYKKLQMIYDRNGEWVKYDDIKFDRALLEDMAKFIETVMQGPPNGLNNLQQWKWDIEQQQIGERIITRAKERLG